MLTWYQCNAQSEFETGVSAHPFYMYNIYNVSHIKPIQCYVCKWTWCCTVFNALYKVGCIFLAATLTEFFLAQYIEDGQPEDAPHFTVLITLSKNLFDVFLFRGHLFQRNKLLLFLHQFENEHLYMLLRHIFDNDLSNQPNYKKTFFIHHRYHHTTVDRFDHVTRT